MDYSVEELLPVVEYLAEKYTSKESTSVSYETARMLMNSVRYSMNHFAVNSEGVIATMGSKIDAMTAYRKGYENILKQVKEAKDVYHNILETFTDYDCMICKDTIIKAMPQFFLYYDARFAPQDHILTLDYPILRPNQQLEGIDAISYYLSCIQMEWRFLSAFDEHYVIEVLDSIVPEYQELFCDNISEAVLETTILGVLNKQNKQIDMGNVELNHRIYQLIERLIYETVLGDEQMVCYFSIVARRIALRWNSKL